MSVKRYKTLRKKIEQKSAMKTSKGEGFKMEKRVITHFLMKPQLW